MKKIIVLLLILIFIAEPVLVRAFNPASTQTYLSSHNSSPWTVMALTALGATGINADHLKSISGTSAIEYSAPILAITSLGYDPRTFGATDYIAKLESFYHDGQIGDVATVNDDIFGVLALISSGVALNDVMVVGAKTFILDHQNSDGGWGFASPGPSDTNMTAAAITALISAGVSATDEHIQSAIQYLQINQNNDGGFSYTPQGQSDAASTAWVLWAQNAMNASPTEWVKSGHNPNEFLESLGTASGYFEYTSGSGEDAFSPITTAYSAIALLGKKLPLKTIDSQPIEKYSFRIEGSSEQICTGSVAGINALDIIKNANTMCGYTYHIANMSWGLYLDQINSDVAQGLSGWLYLINSLSPSVGASDYVLKKNDDVLWHYGEFGWLPSRLTLSSSEISHGGSVTAKVESFFNNAYSPITDATVHYGLQTMNTNANGEAVLNPTDGYYEIFATKEGFIRSQRMLLKVGDPTSATVNLGVEIKQGVVLGDNNGGQNNEVVAFTVDPSSIDFGTLNPSMSSEKNVTITNTGTVTLQLRSTVGGDEIFRDSITIATMPWQNFTAELQSNANAAYPLKLTIPASYTGSGNKSGQITFWAIAQ
ncbi:MAG: Prenyltransferase/squalene oxidase [Parcubacteria group bacterium GW2011_GWA2_38_13]|nr:MAG: Prenyltransferase/squalene oxidase [Parcubacteria group bacterium GW2011_GWA2_38_13]